MALPENKGAEIPIIIDNITHFSFKDVIQYNDLVSGLNKKGYFFITTTRGLFDDLNNKEKGALLKSSHKHNFIAKSEYDKEAFITGNTDKISFKNLSPGEIYYFNDSILAYKTPLQVKYYDR